MAVTEITTFSFPANDAVGHVVPVGQFDRLRYLTSGTFTATLKIETAVDGAAAVVATLALDDGATPTLQVDARIAGEDANHYLVAIVDATDGDADHFDVVVTRDDDAAFLLRFVNMDLTTGSDTSGNATPRHPIAFTKLADGRPDNAAAAALASGADKADAWVQLATVTTSGTLSAELAPAKKLRFTVSGLSVGPAVISLLAQNTALTG